MIKRERAHVWHKQNVRECTRLLTYTDSGIGVSMVKNTKAEGSSATNTQVRK